MQQAEGDNPKFRLTEYEDILTAIRLLRERGLDDEQLVVEVTRLFYVDLDAYNEVVKAA